MGLTPRDFLNNLAGMEGTAFTSWSEAQKSQRVVKLNEAFRWVCRTAYPRFAFPFNVGAGTVVPVDGLISPSSLGDGSWCSLWEADPRPLEPCARVAVDAFVSQEGVHVVGSYTSVFAFFREAVPSIAYADGGDYATPTTLPPELLDVVTLRALGMHLVSTKQWESLAELRKSYDDPKLMLERMVIALNISGVIWQEHCLSLTSAAVVAP